MKTHLLTALLVLSLAATIWADDKTASESCPASEKVYGEWLIRVKPDQVANYHELIKGQGLSLFRAAGGRMVGWWNTQIGDLYEQVTIWEYDSLAAFETAVASLGQNEQFAAFAKLRDPLLTGEQSRFLRLADGAVPPRLPEPAATMVHERHRVPLERAARYLDFMKSSGSNTLRKHGFRPIGPLVVDVGAWSEITYLFPFESLAQREALRTTFAAHPDARAFAAKLGEFVENVTTRVLSPAPFAQPEDKVSWKAMTSPLLPHLTEVVPGVWATGFSDRHGAANCGWITLADRVVVVDLPRGLAAEKFLAEVARIAGKPPRTLVLTNLRSGDAEIVSNLMQHGIETLITTSAIGGSLLEGKAVSANRLQTISATTAIGDHHNLIDVIPLDGIVGQGGAVVNLPQRHVLFAGPFVINGPHAALAGCHTARWVAALDTLRDLAADHVVPGFGSWATTDPVSRQRRYLAEVRRQVGFVISQGRPKEHLHGEVRVGGDLLVWAPYDAPQPDDLDHVYRELTVPAAPFGGLDPRRTDGPHALVLYADQPHEPGYITEGLPKVFEATGVTAHFTVDVRALSPENLAKVDLLVILRDGLQRPQTGADKDYIWMTQEQQDAVVQFVQAGGAFLNLHNSMGLYPPSGGYLDLVGGRYIGHGPLERFRVEVVDPHHPITRSVSSFSIADEQHTPPYDKDKVHLLLESHSDDGTVAAAGWAYEPGKGRLCHLANGHTREALQHPMYQRLLRNAIAWCLRREQSEEPK
ncbi:MAG TPA: ThuA domain-containing protein [Pirellulales bacterium]|nr:ThuA domain-containing protein [Pirellulales bacterium]